MPTVTIVVSAMPASVVYEYGRLVVDIVADVVIVWCRVGYLGEFVIRIRNTATNLVRDLVPDKHSIRDV